MYRSLDPSKKRRQSEKLLKVHGKVGGKNIYDYYGKMEMKRLSCLVDNCSWKIEKFLDKVDVYFASR